MNTKLYLFLLLGVLASCSDLIQEDMAFNLQETKSTTVNNIRYSDIMALNKAKTTTTRTFSEPSFEIDCITKNNDTLLYVCKNEGGGWTIYSSDTRVPAIVAQSESGSYDELMQIDGARLWIQAMAEDMAVIRQLDDDKLNFSKNEIENNKAFWKSISSPDEFVKEQLQQNTTLSPDGIDLPPTPIPTGHYELYYSKSYSVEDGVRNRMTKTNWHQKEPYNQFCPLKSNYKDYNDRAPAGCVAIAGAQMLYFLHEHFGVPETAPSEAYCYGFVGAKDYLWDQYNYTSEIWNDMGDWDENVDARAAAPLIANVGKLLNASYGDLLTEATTSDLVDKVFAPYGISCIYTDNYDVDILKTSLLNDMPVILKAHTSRIINGKKGGHAFIADKYRTYVIVTENHYVWVYDGVSTKPLPYVPDKVEYTYSSPKIDAIGMNWGWESQYNNNGDWYSLTGDWINSWDSNKDNWNISRAMIYGFKVK